MGMQLIPAAILLMGVSFVWDSPVWLLKQGRDELAVEVYSYYRNLPTDHRYIVEDVAYIKSQIAHGQAVSSGDRPTLGAFLKGACKEASMKGMRNRFALVFIMFM